MPKTKKSLLMCVVQIDTVSSVEVRGMSEASTETHPYYKQTIVQDHAWLVTTGSNC